VSSGLEAAVVSDGESVDMRSMLRPRYTTGAARHAVTDRAVNPTRGIRNPRSRADDGSYRVSTPIEKERVDP